MPWTALAEEEIPSSVQAGAVVQDMEREIPKLTFEKKVPLIDIEIPEEEMPLKDDIQVEVHTIEILGNTVIKTSVLHNAVKKYEGRKLFFKDLKELAETITNEYRKRGFFLAKTYFPAQEVTHGTVKVDVLEGKLGILTLKGNTHYSDRFIRARFRATNKGIIHYGRLLKALSLLNEYPGLNVRSVFQTGKTVGTVDLALVIKDYGKLLNYSFDYNNFGSRYVSRFRFGSGLQMNNIFFQGDDLSLRGMLGTPFSQLRYGQLSYWVPVGGFGTKIGISMLGTRYLAGREFKQFQTKGSAFIYSVGLRQPLVRTRTLSIDAELGADYKQIDNYQRPFTHDKDYLRTLRQQIAVDWLDPWQGRTYSAFEVTTGLDMFGASPQDSQTISRDGAGGKFMKFNIHFSRVQKLPFQSLLLFRGLGQLSPSKLASSEQISLGGADSVRGYPISDFLGDQGYNVNAELYTPPPLVGSWVVPGFNKRLSDMIQCVFFIDHGTAFVRKNAFDQRNHRILTGYGPGLRFNLPFDTSLRLDWGMPVGSPEPSDNSNNTFYIQISNSFLKYPKAQ
jgi:hemolysin activation/secretion protein